MRWLGLVLLLVACATHTMRRDTGPRSFTAADYESVYRAWTRDVDNFEWGSMDDVLHVTATYESWEFRWAYVVRYARDHSLDDASRDAMLRATLDDTRAHHRFFVTLSGPEHREQDLSSQRSAWRVLLVDPEGRQTTPVEVRKVRRASAAERVYFPSINPHRQVFRITFPVRHEDGSPTIPEDAGAFRFRLAGARGQVDLVWNFEE